MSGKRCGRADEQLLSVVGGIWKMGGRFPVLCVRRKFVLKDAREGGRNKGRYLFD